MVDLGKQAEAAWKTWTDAQRAIWESWSEAARGLAEARSPDDWARQAGRLLDQWEKWAASARELPVERTRWLADTLSKQERVPREAVELAEQVHRTLSEWSEAQRPVTEAWFATAREFGAARRSGNWDRVMKTWISAARTAAEAQSEMARRLVPGRAGAAAATTSRPRSPRTRTASAPRRPSGSKTATTRKQPPPRPSE